MSKKKRLKDSEGIDNAVLVTGGSGFIGRNLVSFLAKEGKTIVSMYHKRLPEPCPDVFPVCSDLTSVDLLAAPLRGVDTVVYLAWGNNFVGPTEGVRFDPRYENCSSNIRCLKNLLEAMEKAGTSRLIFLSAVGASRRARNPFLKEKYLAEVTVLNARIPEKIIVRSNIVFDPGAEQDQFINSVRSVLKLPGFYPIPRAQLPLAPIHVRDLCRSLNNLIDCEMTAHSAIVEISGQDVLKVEEIFKIVNDRFSKRTRIPLRGAIGNSLVSFVEKRLDQDRGEGPLVKDFVSIGNDLDKDMQLDNPISNQICCDMFGFKDSVRS